MADGGAAHTKTQGWSKHRADVFPNRFLGGKSKSTRTVCVALTSEHHVNVPTANLEQFTIASPAGGEVLRPFPRVRVSCIA